MFGVGSLFTLIGIGIYAIADEVKANNAVSRCHALYTKYGECDYRLQDVEREVWRTVKQKTENGFII